MQPFDLDAKLRPELGIEVAERFVEQEDVDVADEGASDGHALSLPTGQFCRPALEQISDLENVGRPRHAAFDFVARYAGHFQSKGHIPFDSHARIEGVGLKHHSDSALVRFRPGNVAAADPHLAGAEIDQSGNGVEQGRLPAAGSAQQHDELALGNMKIELRKHGVGAVGDLGIANVDRTHPQPFTAPAVMPLTNHRPDTK